MEDGFLVNSVDFTENIIHHCCPHVLLAFEPGKEGCDAWVFIRDARYDFSLSEITCYKLIYWWELTFFLCHPLCQYWGCVRVPQWRRVRGLIQITPELQNKLQKKGNTVYSLDDTQDYINRLNKQMMKPESRNTVINVLMAWHYVRIIDGFFFSLRLTFLYIFNVLSVLQNVVWCQEIYTSFFFVDISVVS